MSKSLVAVQRCPKSWLLAALLVLPVSTPALAFTTVGPQANCAFRTTQNNPIQLALNAGHTELRLVGGATYTGSIVVGGATDVTLIGGFADCTQAANNVLPSNPQASVLVATASLDAAMTLHPAATRRRIITLRSIELRPNLEQTPTGTGLWINGLLDARVERSRITGFNHAGNNGGGVLMFDGRLILSNSEISNNRAQKGGGIYCSSGEVRLDPASRLLLNRAETLSSNGEGGGAYLQQCTFLSQGRVLPSTLGGTSGIVGNQASVAGGGLYVIGGLTEIQGGPFCSDVTAPVCLPRLAIVGANAAQIGGGVYARGGAELTFDFTNLSANTATIEGGGMFLDQSTMRFGGLASLYPNYDRTHCTESICEVMSGNRVRAANVDAGTGGAIRSVNTSITLADVLLDDNTSAASDVFDMQFGSGLFQQVLVRNPDRPAPNPGLMAEFRQATVTIRRSTLVAEPPARRVSGERTLLADPDPQALLKIMSGSLTLNDTLLAGFGTETMPLIAGPNATLTGVCNAHAGAPIDTDLLPISIPVDLSDVAFDGSFAPSAVSDLIDRCVGQDVLGNARDILGKPRRLAQSGGTAATPMDIGAFEHQGSLLFRNSFE
jgi:hypothetical protein